MVVYKLFQFGGVWNLSFGEELTRLITDQDEPAWAVQCLTVISIYIFKFDKISVVKQQHQQQKNRLGTAIFRRILISANIYVYFLRFKTPYRSINSTAASILNYMSLKFIANIYTSYNVLNFHNHSALNTMQGLSIWSKSNFIIDNLFMFTPFDSNKPDP